MTDRGLRTVLRERMEVYACKQGGFTIELMTAEAAGQPQLFSLRLTQEGVNPPVLLISKLSLHQLRELYATIEEAWCQARALADREQIPELAPSPPDVEQASDVVDPGPAEAPRLFRNQVQQARQEMIAKGKAACSCAPSTGDSDASGVR